MAWVLLIVVASGSVISSSANITSLPMQNRAACLEAGRGLFVDAAERRMVSRVCVSSETGEIVAIK